MSAIKVTGVDLILNLYSFFKYSPKERTETVAVENSLTDK
jgi:hypothetical protein